MENITTIPSNLSLNNLKKESAQKIAKETATGGTVRQISELKEGIDQESAKKIISQVKSLKLKIQVKIQGEELRADGKKRDDLQEAIAAIRTIDIGQPMEFVNFRD